MKRRGLPLMVVVGLAIAGVVLTLVKDWSPGLGLDLQGGASVVLKPKNKVESGVLDKTKEIIRQRVDALGVAEPEIARQGDAIIVELPGVKDQKRALELVGQTAELRFRPVLQSLPPGGSSSATTTTTAGAATTTVAGATTTTVAGATTTTAAGPTTTNAPASTTATTKAAPSLELDGGRGFAVQAATATTTATTTAATATTTAATTTAAPSTTAAGATTTTVAGATTTAAPATTIAPSAIPNTPREQDEADQVVVLPEVVGGEEVARYILGPAELTGRSVRTAEAQVNPSGEWEVNVEFNSQGSKDWDAMAEKYYGQQVAIVLDGIVRSAPTINATKFDGRAVISGSFSAREAKDLAVVLRFGSLPVQLEPQTVRTVSASLGKDSLQAGLLTGGIGLALVALYMIFYYRALGLIVIMGLAVSGALMYSLVTILSNTRGLALTLSGAVGIIVSVGITVDSYVVYFERLRDELRSGKTMRSSVDRGFSRAFRTILAADAASFIGAAVLYYLTVGSVRGFAFFLGLSTLLDVIVAYFFTRPLVAILARGRFFTTGPLGIVRNMHVHTAAAAPQRLTPTGGKQ